MSDNKCFFQDFLFENMPVDNRDNPIVDVDYCSMINKHTYSKTVSFNKLMKMDEVEEWEKLYEDIDHSIVYIIDDVPINNNEVRVYKEFYLKTYYFNIAAHCKKCFVVVKAN